MFDRAVEAARGLPPEMQDKLARMLFAGVDQPVVQLTLEERAAIALSKATERREFATEEEVRAIWAKHGV